MPPPINPLNPPPQDERNLRKLVTEGLGVGEEVQLGNILRRGGKRGPAGSEATFRGKIRPDQPGLRYNLLLINDADRGGAPRFVNLDTLRYVLARNRMARPWGDPKRSHDTIPREERRYAKDATYTTSGGNTGVRHFYPPGYGPLDDESAPESRRPPQPISELRGEAGRDRFNRWLAAGGVGLRTRDFSEGPKMITNFAERSGVNFAAPDRGMLNDGGPWSHGRFAPKGFAGRMADSLGVSLVPLGAPPPQEMQGGGMSYSMAGAGDRSAGALNHFMPGLRRMPGKRQSFGLGGQDFAIQPRPQIGALGNTSLVPILLPQGSAPALGVTPTGGFSPPPRNAALVPQRRFALGEETGGNQQSFDRENTRVVPRLDTDVMLQAARTRYGNPKPIGHPKSPFELTGLGHANLRSGPLDLWPAAEYEGSGTAHGQIPIPPRRPDFKPIRQSRFNPDAALADVMRLFGARRPPKRRGNPDEPLVVRENDEWTSDPNTFARGAQDFRLGDEPKRVKMPDGGFFQPSRPLVPPRQEPPRTPPQPIKRQAPGRDDALLENFNRLAQQRSASNRGNRISGYLGGDVLAGELPGNVRLGQPPLRDEPVRPFDVPAESMRQPLREVAPQRNRQLQGRSRMTMQQIAEMAARGYGLATNPGDAGLVREHQIEERLTPRPGAPRSASTRSDDGAAGMAQLNAALRPRQRSWGEWWNGLNDSLERGYGNLAESGRNWIWDKIGQARDAISRPASEPVPMDPRYAAEWISRGQQHRDRTGGAGLGGAMESWARQLGQQNPAMRKRLVGFSRGEQDFGMWDNIKHLGSMVNPVSNYRNLREGGHGRLASGAIVGAGLLGDALTTGFHPPLVSMGVGRYAQGKAQAADRASDQRRAEWMQG